MSKRTRAMGMCAALGLVAALCFLALRGKGGGEGVDRQPASQALSGADTAGAAPTTVAEGKAGRARGKKAVGNQKTKDFVKKEMAAADKAIDKDLWEKERVAELPKGLARNVLSLNYEKSVTAAENCEEHALKWSKTPETYETASLQYRTAAMYWQRAGDALPESERATEYVKLAQRSLDNAEKGAFQEGQTDPECSAFNLAAFMSTYIQKGIGDDLELKMSEQKGISTKVVLQWLDRSEALALQKQKSGTGEYLDKVPELLEEIKNKRASM